MKKIVVFFLMLYSVTDAWPQTGQAVIRNVSVQAFKIAMDSLKDEVVIDLRTPDELKKGKIQGAVTIDFFGSDFEPAIAALDRNKIYLLYCAGGGRSSETAELMSKMGFTKLYNLEEGFNGWVKRRMPIVKK